MWYCVYIQYTFESSIAIERMFLLNYLISCVNDLDTSHTHMKTQRLGLRLKVS